MMKAEKGSEIITTICEYENSVAMPDKERLTYLDKCKSTRSLCKQMQRVPAVRTRS